MRVEPKEVLEQHRVAAELGVEHADGEHVLHQQQEQRDGEHGGGEHLDDRGRVDPPDEQRKSPPALPRGAHLVHGGDEVDAGEDRAEPHDEHRERHRDDRSVGGAAVGGVEGPAGVDRVGHDAEQPEEGADDVDIEAHQVEPGEGDVLRAEHHRQEEVPERGGDRGDDEQEHHHRAVERERLVVAIGAHDRLAGRDQLSAHHERGEPADEKGDGGRDQIQDADPLVVERDQPLQYPGVRLEVVLVGGRGRVRQDPIGVDARRFGGHGYSSAPAASPQCCVTSTLAPSSEMCARYEINASIRISGNSKVDITSG